MAHRLLRRRPSELDVQRLVAKELAVGDLARPVLAVDRHDAFRNREASHLHAEARRGESEQRLARFGRGRAQLRAAAVNR
jgi:hypothetical protein